MGKNPRASRTDGEATRSRILETADQLFAAKGFAETAAKAIAAEAGVDVASINYHFGSRGGLYQAVLIEAHRRFIRLDELQHIVGTGMPPAERLEKLIERVVDGVTEKQGWHARVLARELLAPSSHFSVLFETEMRPKLFVAKRLLSEITSIPEDDPALLRCMVSVAAPSLMMLVVGHGMPGPMQDILRMPPKTLREHLYRFAIAGLEAIAREHARETRRPEG